jgi:hypothetical protein
MVVLHSQGWKRLFCSSFEGVACSQIIRVQVVGDGLWLDAKKALVVGDAIFKSAQGLVVL